MAPREEDAAAGRAAQLIARTARTTAPRRTASREHASRLRPHHRRILAEAYQLRSAEVSRDAARLQAWAQPWDELLASLCRRRGWPAELGIFYLAALRCALQAGGERALWRVGDSPWDHDR
jgi:hypothetical protein